MNQFEFSTLIMFGLILLAVMGYSYLQIARAQKQLKHRKHTYTAQHSDSDSLLNDAAHAKSRRSGAQAGVDSADQAPSEPIDLIAPPPMFGTAKSIYQPPKSAESVQEADAGASLGGLHQRKRGTIGAVSRETMEQKIQLPTFAHQGQAYMDSSRLNSQNNTSVANPAPRTAQSAHGDAVPELSAIDWQGQHRLQISSPQETGLGNVVAMGAHGQAHMPNKDAQLYRTPRVHPSDDTNAATHSVEAVAGQRTARPLHEMPAISSLQELQERAAWAVFEPWGRLEAWLTSAFPQGVDRVDGIDGLIDIVIPQPKVTQDIEQALYDLRLNTELPICLYGARAGSVQIDAANPQQRHRIWEPLEQGAPYSALRLSLQLANRTHCVNQNLLQAWFDLAEKLRVRLGGHIEFLPDVLELAEYARYLHGIARRLGQPLVLQLHKLNGLWPAYEIHQQLSACGAVLNQSGIYIVRESVSASVSESNELDVMRYDLPMVQQEGQRRALYTVMNDMNNPRATDFFRDQIPIMHVHTLSFCLDFALVDAELMPLQRMCEDMRQIAQALDAQWQNTAGDALSEKTLLAHLNTRVRAFEHLLHAIGLNAGSAMTRRLLAP